MNYGGVFMFCRNCGNQIDNMAAVCVHCGVAAGTGNRFCGNCGAPANPGAAICTQCGVPFPVPVPAGMQKSKIAAGILGILLGGLGIHNFYLGYTGKAVAQLLISILSLGFLSFASVVWGIVEGVMILTGSIAVDGKGIPLKD